MKRCQGFLTVGNGLPRRLFMALLLLVASAPVAAQGAGLQLVIDAVFVACGQKGCPPPSDPLQREGFGLRLAGVFHTPTSGVLPQPGSMPRTPSGAIDGNRMQEQTDAARRERDQDPMMQNAVGVNHLIEGRLGLARAQFEAAINSAAERRDRQAAAASQANLGVLAAAQGRYDEARQQLEAALVAYEALEANPEPPASGLMAPASPSLPSWMRLVVPQAQNIIQSQLGSAARDMETMTARIGAIRTRINLGNLEAHLGRYTQAEEQFKQALQRVMRQPERHGEGLVHAELTAMYRHARKSDLAQQHQRLAKSGAPLHQHWASLEHGAIALGGAPAATAAASGAATGAVAGAPAPSSAAAVDVSNPAAAGASERSAEATHQRLAAEAREREVAGDLPGARNALSRAALLAMAFDNPDRERAALAGLQRLQMAAGSADEAILHGKRAVNAVQRLRQSLNGLDRAARQAFLADKKRSYVLLAQTLLDRQRLAEAEHVLRLLKEDEGQQFQERLPGAATRRLRGTVPYSSGEARMLAGYQSLAQRVRALETERFGLRGVAGIYDMRLPDARADIERARRDEIAAVERWIMLFEQVVAQAPQNMRRELALAAKPAASRSAEEAQAVLNFAATGRWIEQQRTNIGAGLRSLERDAVGFSVPLTADESSRIRTAQSQLARIGTQLQPILEAVRNEPPTPQQEAPRFMMAMVGGVDPKLQRLWALDREIEALDAERVRLDGGLARGLAGEAALAFSETDRQVLDTGRRLVGSLPSGTVALYYLSGEARLDILAVSPAGHRAAKIDVTQAALAKRIQTFREALQNPRTDPRPIARELNDWLLAPVAEHLAQAKATTLMLALDGQLRYLPFAALHDGQRWVAERYATTLYTTAAPPALTATPTPRWRVAAFGATEGGQGMSPLPGVKVELEGIVRDPAMRTEGVMPGVIRLNRAFTAAALKSALAERQPVVHIASHFAFTGGEAADSFLLLGDGGKLTLAELAAPDYRFEQVDLVTLSACETALAGDNRFGQEVEGLGTVLQGQGAAAVLATLWPVDDDSTALFMRDLYAAREARGLSRAQALREAQLALLAGRAGAGNDTRGASRPDPGASSSSTQTGATAGAPAAPRPFSHPFYWAPFILMGNWL